MKPAMDLHSFSILVVDDEEYLREAVAFDLRRNGLNVFTAASGSLALTVVEAHKIDLIVSDIRMADGDGISFLEKIRSCGIKTPLIFVTGYTERTEEECLSMGALKVIWKPFDRKALLGEVIEALTRDGVA